jgi:hypothetical protein
MTNYAQLRLLDPNYYAGKSEYAWIVNYDHLDHERVCVIGPHNCTEAQREILMHPRTNSDKLAKFRIYDDDDELYYSGYFLGDAESEFAFGPLDDYGAPNAGAVYIQYETASGEWETL